MKYMGLEEDLLKEEFELKKSLLDDNDPSKF